MGGPQSFEQQVIGAFGKKEMPDLRRLVSLEPRTERIAADLAQGAPDAAGIAGELDGRGVGEKLALARNGSLDDAAEEVADVTDDQHRQAEGENDDHAAAALAPHADAALAKAAQDAAADQADDQNAEDDGGELHIQAHVAVEDVAELMGDYPLQFVAGKLLHRAAGDSDHGVAGRQTGGESVQAGFVVEHVNRRDRHAGGDRHLLDDIEQAALMEVGGVQIDPASADALRD